MKRSIIGLLALLTVVSFSWKGCTPAENNATGKLEFSKELINSDQLKSLVSDEGDISAALVTIVDASGRVVYEKEPVAFYAFGASFISESLSLEVGEYMLSEFFLIDSSGDIKWASPLEGSELAHLVDRPLPLSFSIKEQETTTVTPQVVWIGDYSPEQFGYVSFSVDFVGTFCLSVFYDSECYQVYPGDTVYYENSDDFMPPYSSSWITIWADGNRLLYSTLQPELNTFRISDAYENYEIMVYNCQMDTVYMNTMPKDEILSYSCNNGNPLTISDHPANPDIVITPEGLFEPTIDQGVFGRITVNIEIDSIDYREYYTFPLVADLYIYPGEYNDSIIYWIDESGAIAPEMITIEPLQIVRSNSDGYFQLRMEAGKYLYMVALPWGGYYIDLYMNSRQGGQLLINEAEITKLYISLADYPYFEDPVGLMAD